MSRLSRVRLPSWTVLIAVILFAAIQILCIYLFLLNRRISRELVDRRWAEPTIIRSAAGRSEREILRVYGVGWGMTPPVAIGDLPPHIPNAFLAAEDVRFRSHLGIDPIGIARALLRNVRAGGITQGGSTINQQIIKTRYLTQERKWSR